MTLVLAIAALTSLFIWQVSERSGVYFDDRCFANITYVDASDKAFLFRGNVTFEFDNNKTGVFNLSGNIDYQGKAYRLSRYITFTYNNINGNKYRMKTTTRDIMAHDNVPADLTPLATKIFGMEGEYMLYLHKKDDNYITIANTLSPLMNCVIQ